MTPNIYGCRCMFVNSCDFFLLGDVADPADPLAPLDLGEGGVSEVGVSSSLTRGVSTASWSSSPSLPSSSSSPSSSGTTSMSKGDSLVFRSKDTDFSLDLLRVGELYSVPVVEWWWSKMAWAWSTTNSMQVYGYH